MRDDELLGKATENWNQWLKAVVELEYLYKEYGVPLPSQE
jgi:hypothetical protein